MRIAWSAEALTISEKVEIKFLSALEKLALQSQLESDEEAVEIISTMVANLTYWPLHCAFRFHRDNPVDILQIPFHTLSLFLRNNSSGVAGVFQHGQPIIWA